MKPFLITLSAAALTLAPLAAQDKDKTEAEAGKEAPAAERLLDVMKFDTSGVDAAMGSFTPVLNQFKAQGLPDAAMVELETSARGYFTKVMTDADLRKDVAKLYGELFNEDELEELLAFYQTPTGQKTLFEMPKVLSQAMQLGQKHAEKYAPEFQKEITGIVEKYKAEAEKAPAPKPEIAPDPAPTEPK